MYVRRIVGEEMMSSESESSSDEASSQNLPSGLHAGGDSSGLPPATAVSGDGSTGSPALSPEVSKDIKYADNQPIVPWGPRYSRSTAKDLCINMAISATSILCMSTMGHSDWKPLQFLCFAYFCRMLEKLKSTEPAITPAYNEYGEVEGRGIDTAKRVLRSLGLVLGSIFAASLGYTGLTNFSQFLGHYIPSVINNFQELILTTASSVLLCILASYYR